MKEKSFKFFIKQKSILIDKKRFVIANLQKKIEDLQEKIDQKKSKIDLLDSQEYESLFSLHNAKALQKELKKEITQLNQQKRALEEEIEEIKIELKEIFSQKKALEKMLQKQRIKAQHKKMQEENRLADESHLRKTLFHS
ncbi:hypothetical protein NitYY0826_C0741 [Nitratiruptor sp. YY08-26]|uniref:hypothetical protein n=1 Tax=unclassified Nitratiruptor TaxID=2624044 RepID=UPI0019154CA4|nr:MULTISPECIES: hypothetical protein [unclassified Nitratiruptor]BCD61878.1 hypothetical protein NitYY0813_C0739 [Nitratiruptor sp. YY08-13]BCD65813.1 hypothetical protein NitYY0826_C0741 [Nitratiruptor sp. YY08-26]